MLMLDTIIIAMTSVPGVDELDKITPFRREFGPIETVMFLLLFFQLLSIAYYALTVPKRNDAISKNQSEMRAEMATMLKTITQINAEVTDIQKRQVEFNGLMTSVRGKLENVSKSYADFKDSIEKHLNTISNYCSQAEKSDCDIKEDVKIIATAMQVQAAQEKNTHERTQEVFRELMNLLRRKEGS